MERKKFSGWRQGLRLKTVDHLIRETKEEGFELRRVLGAWQLTFLGVGAIVGAGIFSMVGEAAAGNAGHPGAGPALILSFLMVAVACGFAAFCYAELAAMVPVAGSAYTYAYATLGELAAWVIGWDLILEYAVGNVAVAISWSGYFQELLRGVGLHFPGWLGTDFRSAIEGAHRLAAAQAAHQRVASLGPVVLHNAAAWAHAPRILGVPVIFNLPALAIMVLVTWLLVVGIRESAVINTVMVLIKLAVIGFFVLVGFFYIRPRNLHPFVPNGFAGVSHAAGVIFFAYIGFDAVSTAAEETRHPQRDMPRGMIWSLVICTVIYVVVAFVLTGMVPWRHLDTAAPLATAFSERGMDWAASLVSVGAIIATTSVLLVFQLGQPRIFFAMARDGLLPSWAARVHRRYRTPYVATILTGAAVAVFATVSNIEEMANLTSIGTLFAFILVAVGVLVLRRREPDRPRPFRTPWVPWVPLAGIVSCGYVMGQLDRVTWLRFFIWLAIGLVIYRGYGGRHSRLNRSGEGKGARE